MTPAAVIDLALAQAGVVGTDSDFRSRMLLYFNEAVHDIESRPRQGWWWLARRSTFTTTDGTRLYSLASDCMVPRFLRDQTNNRLLVPTTLDQALERDPDLDEEGDARNWYLAGVSSTTGVTQVGLYPIPGTTGDTIGYEYFLVISELTDADDTTTDLRTAYGMPVLLQQAAVQLAAKRYTAQEGDTEAAMLLQVQAEKIIKQALSLNAQMHGNAPLRLPRPAGRYPRVPVYQPEEGSLS